MADDEWNDDGIDVAGSGPADDSETQDGTDTEEWRFSLDDLGEEAEDDETEFSLYGEVQAGSPSLENAVFVALGLALGLVVFAGLFL